MIFPYKLCYVFAVTLCFIVLFGGSSVALERYVPSTQALSVNEGVIQSPFANSILTQRQVDAWSRYVTYESQRRGCDYLDDERLHYNRIKKTLSAIMDGSLQRQEPLRVTARTWLSLSPDLRNIIGRHVVIASLDCKPVYPYKEGFIGAPLIPFEEKLDLLLNAMKHGGKGGVLDVIRSVRVAEMDARAFVAFFAVPKNRLEMLGMDAETLEALRDDMIPTLVSREWAFSKETYRNQRQKPDERPDAPYHFGAIYTLFPGAKITLPDESGCSQFTRVFSPAESVWPVDDELPGYILSRNAQEPGNKVRGAMEIRYKVESYILERYSNIRMTIKDPKEPARVVLEEPDFAGKYQLAYPFKGLSGNSLYWLQRFYVNKPCAQ